MFGIPNEYVKDIARTPANHSWAVFYMSNGEPDKVECDLYRWLHRFTGDQDVLYILRQVLFLYMEQRAIKAFKAQNHICDPAFDRYIPELYDQFHAVHYVEKAISYNLPLSVTQQAAKLLDEFASGRILPFGAVDIPLPSGCELRNPNRDPFFEVGERPLYWGNFGNENFEQYVPSQYLGIVDLETGYTFSTVSWKYCLYTNKQVYELMLEIAGSVFDGKQEPSSIIDDFTLSRNSGVCKMIVKRAEEEYQPLINDGWQAVLEGINSYDKSEPLRYTFGFRNKLYGASLLMPEYTVSIQTQHTIPFEDFREKVLDRVSQDIQYSEIEASFQRVIKSLRETKLADRDMLPLFCKYFGISAVPSTDYGKERLIEKLRYVERLVKRCVQEHGKNAYALLHVIMDYLSFYSVSPISSDWVLGKWIQDFLKASISPGFSISQYIGSSFYDIASWYEVQ